MKLGKLSDMTGGWFIGDFEPTFVRSKDFEVSIKRYHAGQTEDAHYHAKGTEITVIVSGRARMMDRDLSEGELILLDPGETTGFVALEDTVTCVVKFPSLPGDKFLAK